ncbi:carboxypeptidase-like regulatory domain-containing protein [Hymenobacter sp. BT770]|uniref:carboxypeptidase-like regulatory domain-containing protein n=1 Tax=Hymenobacter sp. BT770 TaxID=2886942 RepID=UPI001D1217C4|nr:carboxypeptidase-like regulatory domain-containing protein [Hymenobacter sp. BT770]MCC3155423.1 carboxypeptidase-like regulatory domain-containing protein [Hymenobacter sp. BT770]MDO3417446.1 carboxypeptidase-like regulatory domain-containing protein [Hymenobacter sp. BT770]
MRSFTVLAASFLSCLLTLTATTSHAQITFASNRSFVSTNTRGNSTTTPTPTTEPTKMMTLVGKITNPAGVLPGAVVILTGTKQMAVTNAEGEFEFNVPANAGPLAARVTYAGYADEPMTLNAAASSSTVNLANATVIVVSRKQQLKAYLKTARKQVKRSLKQIRK